MFRVFNVGEMPKPIRKLDDVKGFLVCGALHVSTMLPFLAIAGPAMIQLLPVAYGF
jgi:hypothetical protein